MALLTSEITRLKYELGFNVLAIGAEPYIGITRLFENIIQPYTLSGAATTSSTSVAEAERPSVPEPRTIVLASATGFSVGDRIVIDVDGRQESATAQALSGSSLSLLLAKEHTGTYPVTVEGGESILRELLRQIAIATEKLVKAIGYAGVKKVDEIELFSPKEMMATLGAFGAIYQEREVLRQELAEAIGIDYMRRSRSSGGGASLSVY